MRYFISVLCVPIFVAGALASPAPIEITARMDGNRYRGATAAVVIDLPPEPLWRVLTDYENDARHYPNTRVSRIIEKNGNVVIVYKKMKFYFFSFNATIEYHEERDGLRLSWIQVSGPFRINAGAWTLQPVGESRTRAIYTIELEHPLMSRWLAEGLLKKNIPEMYRIITSRARELHISAPDVKNR